MDNSTAKPPPNEKRNETGFTICGKARYSVIPGRAARRGISLSLGIDQNEIPRSTRNDKMSGYFSKRDSLFY
jgi:hypothetical protein